VDGLERLEQPALLALEAGDALAALVDGAVQRLEPLRLAARRLRGGRRGGGARRVLRGGGRGGRGECKRRPRGRGPARAHEMPRRATAIAAPPSPTPAPPPTRSAIAWGARKVGCDQPRNSSRASPSCGTSSRNAAYTSASPIAPPSAPCATPSIRKGVRTKVRLAPTRARISSSSRRA